MLLNKRGETLNAPLTDGVPRHVLVFLNPGRSEKGNSEGNSKSTKETRGKERKVSSSSGVCEHGAVTKSCPQGGSRGGTVEDASVPQEIGNSQT